MTKEPYVEKIHSLQLKVDKLESDIRFLLLKIKELEEKIKKERLK